MPERSFTPPLPNPAGRSFFDLVLHLETLLADHAPGAEPIRFRANPSLGFPAEEIERIDPPQRRGEPVVVTMNLLGLHGPASPLPPSITERIMQADEGSALRDLFDLFNHRLARLLVQIGRRYRHELRYRSGGRDAISLAVASLFGRGGEQTEEGWPRRTLLMPYAGLLAMDTLSGETLAQIVRHAFGHPCRVHEFRFREIDIPQDSLWKLGAPDLALGRDTVCGVSIGDVMGGFSLRIGPLDRTECAAFLPGGVQHGRLGALIHAVLREPLAWDVVFVLSPGEAGSFRLGETRLGWSGWLDPDPLHIAELSMRSELLS